MSNFASITFYVRGCQKLGLGTFFTLLNVHKGPQRAYFGRFQKTEDPQACIPFAVRMMMAVEALENFTVRE